MGNAETKSYLEIIRNTSSFKKRVFASLPVFALLVALIVFWGLKLTGITMTGDAFCGYTEHTHSEECISKTLICTEDSGNSAHEHTDACYSINTVCLKEEHTHTASCYSDLTADVETSADWEATFADLPEGIENADRLILIAKSQLGYTESELNFVVDGEGVRHGYTRYGEWFGNPHGEWSTMFTSFCLSYAGFDDVSLSAGADTMRIQWDNDGMYKSVGNHTPIPGDIVFLDKNLNGSADATGVIVAVSTDSIVIVEGDSDAKVEEKEYVLTDGVVMGYGLTAPKRVMMMAAAPLADRVTIGTTASFTHDKLTAGGPFILYTQGTDGNYYAINGDGGAEQIYIDSSGKITVDAGVDTSTLLWSFTYYGIYDGQRSYYIQNMKTGMYLHPHSESGTLKSVLTGRWESAIYASGSGFRIRGARQNAYSWLNNNSTFDAVASIYSGSVFSIGVPPVQHDVWLDGTNGGIMALSGSPDVHYFVSDGDELTLPTQWQAPEKYQYILRGWYDVVNSKYYAPGAKVKVTGDTVFYADWMASTYDIGQFNSYVTDTVSTNGFVTVRMFDYGVLFNLLSESVTSNISSSSHTETWRLLTSGNNPYNGNPTLDFIFRDWDRGGEDISYPSGHNDRNNPTSAGNVYPGLYTAELGNLLFNPENSFDPLTGTGTIGVQYLGTGDHLFRFMSDPDNEHHGYYYYDSERNAASYNQSEQRFYVYDYLECTSDSAGGDYADFLPLNSPYANTNGNTVRNYNYAGVTGEYGGVTHYMYDAKYNGSGNSTDNVGTNFYFGMSVDIDFYLPNIPGTMTGGIYGNRDVYGQQMHFQFSGDDDVWVFVDGELVLDIGGVHGIESGDINFSTGIVTVNGTQTRNIYNIDAGEHTLTIYYMERGSSLSNCAIYFNLAPRFSLSIQKEDVLTQELLDGAEFTVYTDAACTVPAELWNSEADYLANLPSTNVFTVKDGIAYMWGLGSGNTYYIKETKPPDAINYSLAHGIISLEFDKLGNVTYDVDILDDGANGVSNGFTVHGFVIDEETRQAFIVVTNADDTVTETTEVNVVKKWGDTKDHSSDTVTVYLSVRDPDGTVRRIREVILGKDNDWKYTWTNLAKYYADGVTEVEYLVEEAHVPGYTAKIEKSTGGGFSYTITNDVLDESNETSVTVTKNWDVGVSTYATYEQFKVTMKLLANGVDTGRTVTLTLKNGWTDTFYGLPYKDDGGNVIKYTVEEVNLHEDWLPTYGEVMSNGSNPPDYSITVTNTYRWGHGLELPSTGGSGQLPFILSGLGIMLVGVLISQIMMRRKREKRVE